MIVDVLIALLLPHRLDVAVDCAKLTWVAPRALILGLLLEHDFSVLLGPKFRDGERAPRLALPVVGLVEIAQRHLDVAFDVNHRASGNCEVEILGDAVTAALIGRCNTDRTGRQIPWRGATVQEYLSHGALGIGFALAVLVD